MLEDTSSDQIIIDPDHMNRLGAILLRRGKAKKFQVDFLLDLQMAYRKSNFEHKLGELLVSHRIITNRVLEDALMVQEEMPQESLTQILQNSAQEETEQITERLPKGSGDGS